VDHATNTAASAEIFQISNDILRLLEIEPPDLYKAALLRWRLCRYVLQQLSLQQIYKSERPDQIPPAAVRQLRINIATWPIDRIEQDFGLFRHEIEQVLENITHQPTAPNARLH
jgi:hypothetical protein